MHQPQIGGIDVCNQNLRFNQSEHWKHMKTCQILLDSRVICGKATFRSILVVRRVFVPSASAMFFNWFYRPHLLDELLERALSWIKFATTTGDLMAVEPENTDNHPAMMWLIWFLMESDGVLPTHMSLLGDISWHSSNHANISKIFSTQWRHDDYDDGCRFIKFVSSAGMLCVWNLANSTKQMDELNW